MSFPAGRTVKTKQGDDESVASHRIRAGSITNDSFITAFFEDPFRSYLKLVYLLEPYNG